MNASGGNAVSGGEDGEIGTSAEGGGNVAFAVGVLLDLFDHAKGVVAEDQDLDADIVLAETWL